MNFNLKSPSSYQEWREYFLFRYKILRKPIGLHRSTIRDKIENESDVDAPRILTAALGLSSEAGEFTEIVKKMFLQGKPADEDNIFHMKRELGDIMWYWVTACMALNLDPTEVILENQKKLEARYGEKFTVNQSEVRAKGDL